MVVLVQIRGPSGPTSGRNIVPSLGFLVEFEARQGKEDDVAKFLVDAQALVEAEPGTVTWFAFRVGPTSFRIFDAFNSEDDRQTHLHGKVREGIETRGEELFSTPPTITPVDVLAAKLAH
jgi:quinol monooxygenase YgiN